MTDDKHLRVAVLNAAKARDAFAFGLAAKELGSLEAAQHLVRTAGVVRQVDRGIATVHRPDAIQRPGVRETDGNSTGPATMFGHFAVFDEVAEINNPFEGHFLERVKKGAFKRTFLENRDRIRVLFQHGHDPSIGLKPLGPILALEEDAIGARYEVQLLDDADYVQAILPGLRAELYGASFLFSTIREQYVERPPKSAENPQGLPERTLLEVRVHEFGPCLWGAYPSASAAVRAADDTASDDPYTSCLVDMATLGVAYVKEHDDETDNADEIAAMTGVLKTIGVLLQADLVEDEPDGDATRESAYASPLIWLADWEPAGAVAAVTGHDQSWRARLWFTDPDKQEPPPPPRVVLSQHAYEQIRGFDLAGWVELGGPLYGQRYQDAIYVETAYEMSADNAFGSMRLDSDLIVEFTRRAPRGSALVGHWHSEPTAGRSQGPSPSDIRSWRAWAEDWPPTFGGLILRQSEGEFGWIKPLTLAWIATPDGAVRETRVEIEPTKALAS